MYSLLLLSKAMKEMLLRCTWKTMVLFWCMKKVADMKKITRQVILLACVKLPM
jgi:hypothetical protein